MAHSSTGQHSKFKVTGLMFNVYGHIKKILLKWSVRPRMGAFCVVIKFRYAFGNRGWIISPSNAPGFASLTNKLSCIVYIQCLIIAQPHYEHGYGRCSEGLAGHGHRALRYGRAWVAWIHPWLGLVWVQKFWVGSGFKNWPISNYARAKSILSFHYFRLFYFQYVAFTRVIP